ncbi:MAG: ATP-dependent metallopeptidase FtsH/Yme1/Tma family protein [Deltaproteobacteria bacterium]|nr:ATP-dependent metallopeptidase FtsH/Yme1/Tma family protein [Deltaproteobacteria bacterium]
MNQFYKNLALWLVISLVMILLFNMMTQKSPEQQQISYSNFLSALENGQVQEVTIQGSDIKGKLKDNTLFKTFVPDDPSLVSELRERGVLIDVKPEEDRGFWITMLASWGPILLLIAVWVFFMRQMQSGGGKAMSFGKSRAKLLSESQGQVTFKDVAGIDEAKDELEEIVSFLKDPKKFSRLGGRIPKGVLLVGPPGTGKTLLARAIAGEAGVPFFSISGSDFVEMFVGVGASRVRDLFVQGKKNAPCIIFIDEIDAVGRHRGAGLGGGHDEREQTLNQLLVEMDGFESNEGVILIAATNRPDVLDPALLRPGRFDRQVVVPRPDVKGRKMILKVHSRRVPLAPDVDLDIVAKSTPGFSGADLANLVNEAALLAARANKNLVDKDDFEQAKDKVLMGSERRSLVITEKEKRITAVHEAGHALAALLIPGVDPVHKVSIIPRGRALGVTMYLPQEDKYNENKEGLEALICTLMSGRVAEEVALGSITSGASNDIERATAIARKMVCEWGMSDKIGPLSFGDKEGEIFLGRDFGHTKNYSEDTAVLIDNEIRDIVTRNYNRIKKLIEENKDKLEAIAEALLERETVDGDEIRRLVFGDSQTKEAPTKEEEEPSSAGGGE